MASIPSKSEIEALAKTVVEDIHGFEGDTLRRVSDLPHQSNGKLAQGGDSSSTLDRVRDSLNDMPATFSDVTAAGEQMVLRGRQRLDHGVRKQPIEALMLAGAIGYLVGWAASRG